MRKIMIWMLLAGCMLFVSLTGCEKKNDRYSPSPTQQTARQTPPGETQPDTPENPDVKPADKPSPIDAAVKRGLDWLVKTQDKDGLWHDADNYLFPVSSLAGLALLHRAECQPDETDYAKAVKNLTGAISSYANPQSGQIAYKTDNPDIRYAFDHAFAMLFLTQAYQSSVLNDAQKKIVANIIKKGIAFMKQKQHPNGCWYQNYQNGHNDSSTVIHIYALSAAQDAGFTVEPHIMDMARNFNKGILRISPDMIATMVVTGHLTGKWWDEERLGRAAVKVAEGAVSEKSLNLDKLEWGNSYHFHASTTCFYLGGEYWERYYAGMSKWYLANQQESGSWPPAKDSHMMKSNATHTTAVACLILQMPRRALPMYKNVDSKAVRSKLQLEN